jgi:threonine dehydratase
MPNKFDYVLFPIGGGGLASGTVLASKYFGN